MNRIQFIQEHIPYNELGQRWQLADYQPVVLDLMFAKNYAIRCWSEPKKSGKSHITECVLIEEAMTNPNTKIGIFANDSEQAESILFTGCCDLIKKNPSLTSSAKILAKEIRFSNNSEIEWFAADYEGGAGHRRRINAIDEPWAFSSERMRRLYEELLPIPTIPNSYLWLSTTAGFSGEGELLEELYKRGISGKRISRKYEVYQDKGLVMFWSHKPRQRWQTKAYYDEQRRLLRANTFARQHENRWVSSESVFITHDQWTACVDHSRSPLLSGGVLYLGVDVGVKSDNAAVVGVAWDAKAKKIVLATHRAWRPTKMHPVNLQDIEDHILELRKRHRIVRVYADPYQAMQMLQSLQRKMGETVVQEFPQTVANCTVMGEELYALVKGKNLVAYPDSEMQAHVTNATGVETARGFRIAKEKASKKIDLAVALAMSCCAALQAGKPITDSHAVPIGVGQGIGATIKKEIGSTLDQPNPFVDDGRLSHGIPIRQGFDDDEEDSAGLQQGIRETYSFAIGPMTGAQFRESLKKKNGG